MVEPGVEKVALARLEDILGAKLAMVALVLLRMRYCGTCGFLLVASWRKGTPTAPVAGRPSRRTGRLSLTL
jgi:hypothetical protein